MHFASGSPNTQPVPLATLLPSLLLPTEREKKHEIGSTQLLVVLRFLVADLGFFCK
jgi:hypothetical protein